MNHGIVLEDHKDTKGTDAKNTGRAMKPRDVIKKRGSKNQTNTK
jgi:hypothetical protein